MGSGPPSRHSWGASRTDPVLGESVGALEQRQSGFCFLCERLTHKIESRGMVPVHASQPVSASNWALCPVARL